MAAPTPASSSERPTGRAGEPVAGAGRRRRPVAPGHRSASPPSSTARCASLGRRRALNALPALLRQPDAAVWVDLTAPSADQVEAVGAALGAPSAHRRGHPRGQPAGQDRDDRRRRPHRDVRARVRGPTRSSINEIDIVLGLGFLLIGPRPRLGPARLASPAQRRRRRSWATGPDHLLWAHLRRHRRRLLPVRRPARRCHRRGPGRGRPHGRRRTRSSGSSTLKRELIEVRRAVSPVREVFNQLTNRDLTAHRCRGDHLLPRRLRPRHPADRRARQLPRAGRRDPRRLPDPGQQQPVGDHEAADRGHGHPGRDRRGGRHLRDERGRHRAPGGGTGSGWSPAVTVASAGAAAFVLRRIGWI